MAGKASLLPASLSIAALLLLLIAPTTGQAVDYYVGPFDSWINVKVNFSARTDGSDTRSALQAAFDFLKQDSSRTLYFPAGTYVIGGTLNLSGSNKFEYTRIIGESPETTIILYDGPAGGKVWSELIELTQLNVFKLFGLCR